MKKSRITICICLLLCACSSAPKKDLTTRGGVISAYFNIDQTEYEKLAKLDMQEDDTLLVLLLATATALTVEDIVMRIRSGYLIEDIVAESSLEAELIRSRLEKIKSEIR